MPSSCGDPAIASCNATAVAGAIGTAGRFNSDRDPGVHLGEIEPDRAIAAASTYVDRGAVAFAIQNALDLRLGKMTDRALVGDGPRGWLVVSHDGYLLNDRNDVLRLASRRPTFQISPHVKQRQYDATVTDLLVVLMSLERQAGQAVGAATDPSGLLPPVLSVSRIPLPWLLPARHPRSQGLRTLASVTASLMCRSSLRRPWSSLHPVRAVRVG
jgi:hypothetical protein